MKIQLDTDNKTIKLEEDILLSKLVETLGKLLPNKEWKKFTLQTNTKIAYWNSPIVIEKYIKPTNPFYPWYVTNQYSVTSSNKQTAEYKGISQNSNLQLKAGVFNVEV